MVKEAFPCAKDVVYEEKLTFLNVLELTRDQIHKGYALLTHPLAGSVKPGETPYKTIILSSKPGELNLQSLSIIEDSIILARHLIRKGARKPLSEKIDRDFQLIDYHLIEDCIKRLDML